MGQFKAIVDRKPVYRKEGDIQIIASYSLGVEEQKYSIVRLKKEKQNLEEELVALTSLIAKAIELGVEEPK